MYLVSRKLDYALRALTYLSTLPEGKVALAREIAEIQHIPMRFLQKIMKELVANQLARSFHGPGGGYALAGSPKAITLKQVIEAVEGPIILQECIHDDPGCGIYERCTQITTWKSLHEQFVGMLSKQTLQDLTFAPSQITPVASLQAR